MGLFEIETHLPRTLDRDLGDLGELGAIAQTAFVHQQVEGKAHVLGAHRLAIGERRARVDLNAQPGVLWTTLHAPSNQTIDGVGLIE